MFTASSEAGSSATATSVSTGESEGEAGEAGAEGPVLDIMAGDGTGTGGGEGCQNVDFLFMVDASPSMVDEQQLLIQASGQWISTIQSELPAAASNYRVMVVDLDDRWGHPSCSGCNNGCNYQDGSFFIEVPDYPCSYSPNACDQTLGAGMTFPAGDQASNVDCNFPDGRRWLEASDPNVDATFACAATVGASGSGDEQVAKALEGAVSDAALGSGGCNEGFLRDDAILVVVVVTDEDEADFVDDQLFVEEFGPGLRQRLVDLKGGDEDGIVMVGLINDFEEPGGICTEAPPLAIQSAKNLRDFISSFSRHELGSVCAADYNTPLSQAVATISEACDAFVPVP